MLTPTIRLQNGGEMSYRLRNRNTAESAVPVSVDYWTTGGGGTCANPYPKNYIGKWAGTQSLVPKTVAETMLDYVTPEFKKISAKGGIVNSSMSRTKETWDRRRCYVNIEQVTYYTAVCSGKSVDLYSTGKWWNGQTLPETFTGTSFLSAPALDLQRAKDVAVTGAWAKAQTSEILALTTLAEGKKTIQSIGNILKRIVHIGRLLRKGRLIELSRQFSAKNLADRWMEGRYAIRPLCYDMAGALAAFRATKKPPRQTFRSGGGDQGSNTQGGVVTYSSVGYGYGNGVVYSSKATHRTISVRSGVLASLEGISNSSIWGLDQPFESIWELIPFSFVVDWFLNVGKTIASWTPNPGIKGLASWSVVEDTTSYVITVESSSSNWNVPKKLMDTYSVTGGQIVKTVWTQQRMANPLLPIIPSFNFRVDAAKLLDLVIMGKRIFR